MLAQYFVALLYIHVGSVCISGGFFTLRAGWMLADSGYLQRRWVKVLPHVVDSALLASAVGLAMILHQYPFVQAWLTAKVLALVAYIGLGTVGLKRGRTKRIRVCSCVAALAVFAYIITVALAHDPRGWLLWL